MNKRSRMLCIIAFLSFLSNHINCTHIISLFLNTYPRIITQEKISRKTEKIKQPGRLAYYSLKGLYARPNTAGIFAIYKGYITISSYNGQIIFPNKQTQPVVKLLITTRLTPLIMTGNTIHHWELETERRAELYQYERKQDEETENYYWTVRQIPLPENQIVPIGTIWLVAQPKKIFVPIGITPTDKSQNFILPPIYVKNEIINIHNTLYILNLKHFFLPVKKEFLRNAKNTREIVF